MKYRHSSTLTTGNTVSFNLWDLWNKNMSASVASDQEVTFWFEWGQDADDYASLPHSSKIVTCAAGESKSLLVDVVSQPTKARFVISNASGSTATLIADFGTH